MDKYLGPEQAWKKISPAARDRTPIVARLAALGMIAYIDDQQRPLHGHYYSGKFSTTDERVSRCPCGRATRFLPVVPGRCCRPSDEPSRNDDDNNRHRQMTTLSAPGQQRYKIRQDHRSFFNEIMFTVFSVCACL